MSNGAPEGVLAPLTFVSTTNANCPVPCSISIEFLQPHKVTRLERIMNVVEEIQKLKALLDSGTLTEDEFISAKAALLSKQGATPDAKTGRSSPSKAPALALVGVLVTGAGGTGIFFYQQEQARVAEVARLKAEHDARELSAR